MPYRSSSPSGNSNISSNGYWTTPQGDGLSDVVECEGRDHLKYNIKMQWISKSASLKVDILNFKHSPYLLFLMTAEFYRMLWTCSYVVHSLGECFVSKFSRILKICKIYNRKLINLEFMG